MQVRRLLAYGERDLRRQSSSEEGVSWLLTPGIFTSLGAHTTDT